MLALPAHQGSLQIVLASTLVAKPAKCILQHACTAYADEGSRRHLVHHLHRLTLNAFIEKDQLYSEQMITNATGNLLSANAEALVNAFNTVGVMGKGLALQFKKQFPENDKLYKAAAEAKSLHTGKMFVVPTNRTDGLKWIINFPTKQHWRHPSKQEYITEGLNDLVEGIKKQGIKSIAWPALGCGNGGLNWKVVKPLIAEKLAVLDEVDIYIYEPHE